MTVTKAHKSRTKGAFRLRTPTGRSDKSRAKEAFRLRTLDRHGPVGVKPERPLRPGPRLVCLVTAAARPPPGPGPAGGRVTSVTVVVYSFYSKLLQDLSIKAVPSRRGSLDAVRAGGGLRLLFIGTY